LKAIIHCNPGVPWQPKRAAYFAEGFKRAGIPYRITDSRTRLDEGFPVLLGTTFWRGIERDGGEYLLVDRCSFGDTEKFVQLVWNGHGRRGDHRVPEGAPADRWELHGQPLLPWRDGRRVVLCGQTETYSPHFKTLSDWYEECDFATHFRRHPAGDNPTGLPEATTFDDVQYVETLNSSIGAHCILNGIRARVWDEGSMAWSVGVVHEDADREPWCHWLAWTQWTDDEIREGIPWAYHL